MGTVTVQHLVSQALAQCGAVEAQAAWAASVDGAAAWAAMAEPHGIVDEAARTIHI